MESRRSLLFLPQDPIITGCIVDEKWEKGNHLHMPTPSPADEQLKNRVIEHARAGDYDCARQTIRDIVARKYLREAWLGILYIQMDRKDVQGIKETIAACPDHSLLTGHSYRELPLAFSRAGDASGAIEIAIAMGPHGVLPLMLISIGLASEIDFVGARRAAAQIKDKATRNAIVNMVEQIQMQQTNKGPEESNRK